MNATADAPRYKFPRKYQCLFRPMRYKILHGGRGSAKSWSVARWLLLSAGQSRERILCTREYQNAVKDSVHQLLCDQIERMHLESEFKIFNTEIVNRATEARFAFTGLHFNVDSKKSMEGFTKAWVEEGHTTSKASWTKLTPTIREPNSEIIVTMNVELDTDELYSRFVIGRPWNAYVVEVNYNDNPDFPQVLRDEMEDDKRLRYQDYLTTWLGKPRAAVEGAVYLHEMQSMVSSGRLTSVPFDPSIGVRTFWDMGWSDMTAIWFVQRVGFEFRMIRYMQDRHRTIKYFYDEMQKFGYSYAGHFMPHDAGSGQQAAGGISLAQQLRNLCDNSVPVRVLPPPISKATQVAASRAVFPNCWFDKDNCADGVQSLRRYKYQISKETLRYSREPLHDDASHGADAFGAFAEGRHAKLRPVREEPKPDNRSPIAGGWMQG